MEQPTNYLILKFEFVAEYSLHELTKEETRHIMNLINFNTIILSSTTVHLTLFK